MRALAFSLLFASACGPKVSTRPLTYDEDLQVGGPKESTRTPAIDETAPERPVAPPGKGLRTGTVARDRLIAILDAGPAQFLRQLEVTPRLDGERFIGWELVQLVEPSSPLYDLDLVPGDILLAVNGLPISRPDQLQTVWDSLRTANQVTAQLWRGTAKLTIEFAIEPAIVPATAPAS